LQEEQKFNILIVDDEPLSLFALEAALGALGQNIVTARSGREALRCLLLKEFAVILLDIQMPEMDGFETATTIRQWDRTRDTPIIFMTAAVQSDTNIFRGYVVGAVDYVFKPVHPEILRSKLSVFVELARKTEIVKAQRDALQHIQQQKDELSALLVHDLKNPLNSIMTLAKLLTEPSFQDKTQEFAHDISAASSSMFRMVMNLLDISRSEDGVLTPVWEQVELTEMLQQIRHQMSHLAQEHKQNITITAPSLLMIRADRDLLQRLFENLLDNALKYSPANAEIALQVKTSNNTICVRLSDNGQGIPEEYREKIFEKYVQLETGKSKSSRGLGLRFCRLAAEVHGGRIWVEENLPMGSVFCVELPMKKARVKERT
jgi:two-component system sensor histidine kinase/response regulator